jgi:hypothetical protein
VLCEGRRLLGCYLARGVPLACFPVVQGHVAACERPRRAELSRCRTP